MDPENTLDQADQAGPPALDLRDLEAQAAAIEGAGPPGAPGAPLMPPEDPVAREARELLGALQLARMLVAPLFRWWPEFGQVWGDQTITGISQNGAAVLVRQGWSVGEIFEKWGPYIGLAVATAPPCIATHQAIQWHRAQLARQAKEAANKPAPEAAPGGHPQ